MLRKDCSSSFHSGSLASTAAILAAKLRFCASTTFSTLLIEARTVASVTRRTLIALIYVQLRELPQSRDQGLQMLLLGRGRCREPRCP